MSMVRRQQFAAACRVRHVTRTCLSENVPRRNLVGFHSLICNFDDIDEVRHVSQACRFCVQIRSNYSISFTS